MGIEEQIVHLIGQRAYESQYLGLTNLRLSEELYGEFPQHKKIIDRAFELIDQIKKKQGIAHRPPSIPKEILIESASNLHREFVSIMPDFFGLEQNIPQIPIHLENIKSKGSVIGGEDRILFIELNNQIEQHSSYLDFLFTVAHETAHYMHSLRRPRFYTEVKTNLVGLHGLDLLHNLDLLQYREFVADSSAIDFFHRTGRLEDFIQEQKANMPYQFSRGRYSASTSLSLSSLNPLIALAVYKEALLDGSLPRIIQADIDEKETLELLESKKSRIKELVEEDYLLGAWYLMNLAVPRKHTNIINEPCLFN